MPVRSIATLGLPYVFRLLLLLIPVFIAIVISVKKGEIECLCYYKFSNLKKGNKREAEKEKHQINTTWSFQIQNLTETLP